MHTNEKEQTGRKNIRLKVLERNHSAEQKGKLKLLIKLLQNVPLKD